MLRKTRDPSPYNVFVGMCLMILPAAPVLAGVADNNAQGIISTKDAAPDTAAKNSNTAKTNGKFLASSSPAKNAPLTGSGRKSMLAPQATSPAAASVSERTSMLNTPNRATPAASGASHLLARKNKMLFANPQSINDGNKAVAPQTATRGGNTSGLLTPRDNSAVTLTQSKAPLTGSGMLVGKKPSAAPATTGANKVLAGSRVVFTEDTDNGAVTSATGDTSTTKRSSFLVKDKNAPALASRHSETPAGKNARGVFTSGETSSHQNGLVITVDDDSAVGATTATAKTNPLTNASATASESSAPGVFATSNVATTGVFTTDKLLTRVNKQTDTAFLTKNPTPANATGTTGLFASKTSTAGSHGVTVTMSDTAPTVASPGANTVALSETVSAPASNASATAASTTKRTSISVSTSEEGMPGFYPAPGSVTLTTSSITTSGDGGTGIFSAEGSDITVDTSVIATAGLGAAGVSAVTGAIAVSESAIATAGDGSAGVFSSDAGTVSVTRSAVATAGEGAAGVAAIAGSASLENSTVRTIGTESAGIFAIASGTVSSTNTTITTSGDHAHGVFTNNGSVTLSGGSLTTHGAQSAGIVSETAGTVTASNTSLITTGENASGVTADSGLITLADSAIQTSGAASSGMLSTSTGTVNATNTTVITTGENASGVSADNGAIVLTDSSVNTRGSASAGIFSASAGSVTATNATIVTTGANASGVSADNGAVMLTDSSVNTRGNASHGIFSAAAGSVTAANTTIIASGNNANGVLADNGSVTLTDSSVNTRGNASNGIFSGTAGNVNASNTTILTSGESARGVFADNGKVTLTDSLVNTRNTASVGIFSGGNGSVDATNTTILTTGEKASGVFADNGKVTLTDSLVNTHNTASVGIFSGNGGSVEATGTNVTTAGENAHALSVNQGAIGINNGMLKAGNGAGIFATGNDAALQAGEVALNAVTIDAAKSSVLTEGGMLNLNATGTTFNSDTRLVLDVRADATNPESYSNVNLNADSSMLNGSLVSDNTLNTTTVSLSNNSTLTGRSENISSVSLDGTSRWYMTGNSDVQSLTNNGTIIFSEPGSGDDNARAANSDYKTLTVNGDYAGNGGMLVMNTLLGGDGSPTDKLVVTGDVKAGDTNVAINNMGGSGAWTVDGIEVVSVGGTSEGTFTKSGRIVAGAYDYELEKVNESWYLTNKAPDVTPPDPGPEPEPGPDPEPGPGPGESQYRPETGSYLANMLAANTMFDHRMQDRLGEGSYARTADGERADGMWMRHVGSHNRFYDESGQLKARTNRYVLQLGYDLAQWSSDADDRWHVGIMGGYGNAQSNIRSALTGYRADSKVEGYSAGMYATWVESDREISGAYVDGWVLYNWFRNTINGEQLATEKYDSKGLTASVEAGYTVQMTQGERVSSWLQPKAQLTWLGVRADNHREQNGTWVSDETDGMLRSRLGVRTYLKGYSELDENTDREFQPFVEANWLHNFGDYSVKMDDVTNSIAGNKNIGELKLGVEGRLADDFTMWGNVAQQVGSAGYSDTSAVFGTRVNF